LSDEQKKALREFANAGGDKVQEQNGEGFFNKMKDAFSGKK
jgi:molecular chaperone DnaJ